MDSHYDAVVIGSGFGGSINALRLAQAGKSVLILERGRRYPPGSFPRDTKRVNELLWRYPRNSDARGLYDIRFLSGVATVTASGVGGGSLIYANIHIRPDPIVFENERWPRSINRARLDPYYDKVASMLQVEPVPETDLLPKRDAFRRAAKANGRPIFDPDEAVSWRQPADPARHACQRCGECEFGCQYGAKNTLDFTYLAGAERLGSCIQTGAFVTHIGPTSDGYRVHFVDLDTQERREVTGRRVIISAGTLGTNEILLRSRDVNKTLPLVSRRLGVGYSANGDFLGSIQNSATDLHSWTGPDVTSVIRYFDSAPEFTMAAPTFNRPAMTVLASMGQPNVRWLRFLSPLLWPLMNQLLPLILKLGLLSRPSSFKARNAGDPARMTNLFAIGRDDANGVMSLKCGRLDIAWDYARQNEVLVRRMTEAMEKIADTYGGAFSPLPTWNLFNRIITVHSLGGCHLSDSPQQGVVSPRGEVHGYPGLYVADGSVIPTAIGFHPVMTISAVSEHIAEAVVASYSG